MSELISLEISEISTYEKMHYELKNLQNVLGILLKTILKFRKIVPIRTSIPINCRILDGFDTLFGPFGGK